MPEAYTATTVTLSGPVTFADGTTTRTITGGDRDQYLDLAVPAGTTDGELEVDLSATMPSTELTVLADEQYRDLLIAGQERTVEWGARAGFAIDEAAAPDFARLVDIHRKPGYDPAELFFDPAGPGAAKARAGVALLRKKLGFQIVETVRGMGYRLGSA